MYQGHTAWELGFSNFLPAVVNNLLLLARTSLFYKQFVYFDLLDLAKLFEFRDIDDRQIAYY